MIDISAQHRAPQTAGVPGIRRCAAGVIRGGVGVARSASGAIRVADRAAGYALAAAPLVWKRTVSRVLGGHCRFAPTCSNYAADACIRHGALAGLVLTACRVCRCNSLFAGGVDPVPDARPIAALLRRNRGDRPKITERHDTAKNS